MTSTRMMFRAIITLTETHVRPPRPTSDYGDPGYGRCVRYEGSGWRGGSSRHRDLGRGTRGILTCFPVHIRPVGLVRHKPRATSSASLALGLSDRCGLWPAGF